MRKPKALAIPFKFREGYPDEIVDPFIEQAINLIGETGIDFVQTKSVIYDNDADYVAGNYNPNEYDFTVLIMPTWFEPVTVVRAAKPYFNKPIVVWGFSNFSHKGRRVNLGSSAGAGVAKGTLREYGVNHEYIYYSPGVGHDNVIKNKLSKIANVSRAMKMMHNSRILCIGYQFGGMTLGDMDLTKMRQVFGPDLIELDSYTLISQMDQINSESETYKENATKIVELTNGSIGAKLEPVTRMYTVLKNMVGEYNAQALTLKCHFALSQEYGLTACIPLSVIGTEIVASCEADIPLTLTELLLHYLSNGRQVTYGDTHELKNDTVLWGACGFAPAGMCVGEKITCQLPVEEATGLGATFGDYITNKNWLKAGRMTVARILKDTDGGFTLHATTGTAVGEIGEVSEFGAPQYAFTDMKLDCDMDSFAQHLGSHHYALVYAELAEELQLYSKFMEINYIND